MCSECLSKGFTSDARTYAGLSGVLLPKAVVGGCWDGGSDGFFLMASSEAELLMPVDLGHALTTRGRRGWWSRSPHPAVIIVS